MCLAEIRPDWSKVGSVRTCLSLEFWQVLKSDVFNRTGILCFIVFLLSVKGTEPNVWQWRHCALWIVDTPAAWSKLHTLWTQFLKQTKKTQTPKRLLACCHSKLEICEVNSGHSCLASSWLHPLTQLYSWSHVWVQPWRGWTGSKERNDPEFWSYFFIFYFIFKSPH